MDAGVFIEPQFGFSFEAIRGLAAEAEGLGFRHLWVSDHFFLRPDEPDTDCLEAWTLLAALSQITTRLRLGTLVTSQSYRHPALLAKMAAALAVMSGGRLELGIGTGWKAVEYGAYGFPFPPAPVRVGQLVDALEIIRRMWTEERATYHGSHYHVEAAPCAPKPLQQPRPPILLGVYAPRMTRVAVRYADAVNLRDFFASPDVYAGFMARVDAACRREGRKPATLRRTHTTYTIVARTPREVEMVVEEIAGRLGEGAPAWRERLRGASVGTPAEVVERAVAYRAAGASELIFLFPYGFDAQMLRLVGEEVLPALG